MKVIPSSIANPFIKAHHYSGKVPALWRKVEIIHENTKRIWQPGVDYALGDSVFYPDENGTEYACITAHTSQTGWEPPNTPALWQKKTPTKAPQIALN